MGINEEKGNNFDLFGYFRLVELDMLTILKFLHRAFR